MSRLVHFPADALSQHALGGAQPVAQVSLPQEPQARLKAIGEAIERVVVESYDGKHKMAHRTIAEDARRANICVTWFNRLVNEHRWTHDRALSAMRHVLSDALDGKVPTISKATMWVPDKTLVRGLA